MKISIGFLLFSNVVNKWFSKDSPVVSVIFLAKYLTLIYLFFLLGKYSRLSK